MSDETTGAKAQAAQETGAGTAAETAGDTAAEMGGEMGGETPAPMAPSSLGHTPIPDKSTVATATGGMSMTRIVFSMRRWWREDVVGTVDQAEVIERRREDCLMSERYLFLTAMSAGIAVLGLLLSSPAVVIGAMLLSPLMGPIMGLGFALAIGDYLWLRQSAVSLAWGSAIAILLTAALVYLSPIQTITPEIAARTQPNLFDLLIALFSAMAGAYAMIRGREGTIVGVAIATALMPPLAVVGFGLATSNGTVFWGALLLYVTNLITIALTSWAMARMYGFKTSLSQRQSQFQNFAIVAVFIALAVYLGLSLVRFAGDANAQRITRNEILARFPESTLINDLQVDYTEDLVMIDATVLTPQLEQGIEDEIERALTNQLGRPVEMVLAQYQFGTSASAAERAQLSAARANQEAAAVKRANDLAQRLALVAGVPESDVIVDRTRRRAMVRAQRLEGAGLATYRALEARIAASEPDWTIELIPPIGDLPGVIGFEDADVSAAPLNTGDRAAEEASAPAPRRVPTRAGAEALDLIAWAGSRLNLPIVLSGPPEDAALAAQLLAARGVQVRIAPETGAGPRSGPLRADWDAVGEENGRAQ
ncbi:MAG: TIGR00341 family protein [Pseudomonadota bacterium]